MALNSLDAVIRAARSGASGVVAVGNPCRVMRQVGEHDRKYYYRDREIDPAFFEKK